MVNNISVGVVGSRYYAIPSVNTEGKTIEVELNDLTLLETAMGMIGKAYTCEISMLVSGGAKGIDTLAQVYGDKNLIPVKVFKPDWEAHGRGAGFRRNKDIVNEADVFIVIWNGVSKGTMHTIDLIKQSKKPALVLIVPEPGVCEYEALNASL